MQWFMSELEQKISKNPPLESFLEESKSHGTGKSEERARSRKKMLARERNEYLLDVATSIFISDPY